MNSGRVFRKHLLSVSCVYLVSLQPARAEWAAAAYFGGARTAQTALRVQAQGTDLRIHPISYRANSFQSPIYYGYRAGYFFTRHFGVEGEFTHLKVYADTARNAQFSGSTAGIAPQRHGSPRFRCPALQYHARCQPAGCQFRSAQGFGT